MFTGAFACAVHVGHEVCSVTACGKAVQEQSCGCRDGVQPEPCLVGVGPAWMRALGVAHRPEAFENVAAIGRGQGRCSLQLLYGVPAITGLRWPDVAGVVFGKAHNGSPLPLLIPADM